MGSHFTKFNKPKRLAPEEHDFVKNTFMLLSQNKDYLKCEDLTEAWSYLVDPEFVQYVRDGCFRKHDYAPIKMKRFADHFYVAVKGTLEEKADYISTNIFDNNLEHSHTVATTKVIGFANSTVRSYFLILSRHKTRPYLTWTSNGVTIDKMDGLNYSKYVNKDIMNSSKVSADQIELWLSQQPLFQKIWKEVVVYLYSHLNPLVLPKQYNEKIFPYCNVPDRYGPLSSVLSIGKLMFINNSLPIRCQRIWTPLFNSKLHGESFTSMMSKIIHRGPTVILVSDDRNYLFGGFAPVSWNVGPKFEGDLTATLFTLSPEINIYTTSGHNEHFQYFNTNQQTMPNGLGMGGQFYYWGLWIDETFVNGQSSETCSTFSDYSQLSSRTDFEVHHIEVWSVGDERKSIGALEFGDTILGNNTDKFMLELKGHTFHSGN